MYVQVDKVPIFAIWDYFLVFELTSKANFTVPVCVGFCNQIFDVCKLENKENLCKYDKK